MSDAKMSFESHAAKPKATSKGISRPRAPKKPRVMAPARRSSRQAGEAAEHIYVTGESGGKVGVAGLPEATKKLADEMASVVEERRDTRKTTSQTLTLTLTRLVSPAFERGMKP